MKFEEIICSLVELKANLKALELEVGIILLFFILALTGCLNALYELSALFARYLTLEG